MPFEIGDNIRASKLAIDPATGAARATLRGPEYGALGSYVKTLRNGASVMAAGLAGGAVIGAFRYDGANRCLVRHVHFSMAGTSTAFAAGNAFFDLFAARGFTAPYTGGNAATLTGNNGKLQTDMGTTEVADFRVASTAALSVGSPAPTLDGDPMGSLVVPITTATGVQFVPLRTPLWRALAGDNPFSLVHDEGFVLQATVPATGTWNFALGVEWDEVPLNDWR